MNESNCALYMKIECERQGIITEAVSDNHNVPIGSNGSPDAQVRVLALSHALEVPRDLQSGLPSGQRIHHPISITKTVDHVSPRLYDAFTSGELIRRCTIEWYRVDGEGTKLHYFTHDLEDALITRLRWTPATKELQVMTDYVSHLEFVELSYRKLTLRHELSGAESCDDWRGTFL